MDSELLTKHDLIEISGILTSFAQHVEFNERNKKRLMELSAKATTHAYKLGE